MKLIMYALLASLLFTACGDEDENQNPTLELSQTSCTLSNAKNYIVIDIRNGAGQYTVASSNAQVAQAEVDNSEQPAKLYIFGFGRGDALITVTDKDNNKATVNVRLNEEILIDLPTYSLIYLKKGESKTIEPQLEAGIQYTLLSQNENIVSAVETQSGKVQLTGLAVGKTDVVIAKDYIRPVLGYEIEVFDILPLLVFPSSEIRISVDEEIPIRIECGNGNYVVTQNSNDAIVETQLLDADFTLSGRAYNPKKLKVNALAVGTTKMTITDAQNQKVEITIIVTSAF